MAAQKINHNALTHLVEAGAVVSASASAQGDIWTLTIQSGDTQKIVMAKNSGKPRIWRKLDTLARYIQDLGLSSFEIDVSGYDANQKSLKRPDSAETLKRTHQAHKTQMVDGIRKGKIKSSRESKKDFKQRWEERRAKILAEENPRAK